ncbi:unnamed protein product [Peronospora belbahrii]|uniref:Uncharacterized protein n=1 Tax=Peronospora belbahrii TaxID=622444 RepID=A0AAU9KZU2_9STRA|nr:unnamed protein product [Peronospora belbahrii]CAH0514350.1 unnamed protein product [Peronospora belbahrii]
MKSVADELKEFMDKMKKATEKLKEFGLEKIKIVDTLFKNQLFEKYESYMRSAFGSKSDMVVIKMLEDNLGDTIVAKQIAAGIVKPGAELMAEWRTKQFKLWLIEGKQPDDVKSKSKANAADELLKQVWRAYEIFHGKRKVT